MSMRKCPECGKEISDKAYTCPNCGYPISNAGSSMGNGENISSEKLDMFASENIKCPVCGSQYYDVSNGIPIYKKIFELWVLGFILLKTRDKYKNDMIYHCKKCGTIWDNNKIIQQGTDKSLKIGPAIPVTIGVLSILFAVILAAIAFTVDPLFKVLLMITACLMLSAGVLSLMSIGKQNVVKASCILYQISGVFFIAIFLLGRMNLIPLLITVVFFWCMKTYERKLS